MKFDLLFSDLVALFVGLLGLIAAVIALQNSLTGVLEGATVSGAVFALIALTFFLPARRFLVGRSYESMLRSAASWQRRIPFVVLHSVWILLVTFFLLGTKPQDFFGVLQQAPWLFSPVTAVPVLALFAVVFVLPGLAFRPYVMPRQEEVPKRGLLTRIRHNRQAILIDSHPITETICKVAEVACAVFITACIAVFMMSDTHAALGYLQDAKAMLYPLTIIIFVMLYMPRNFGIRIVPETGDLLFTAKRKLFNAVLLFGLSYGLAYVPYYYMIPWAYNHLLASEQAEIPYELNGFISYKGCQSGLSFAYPDDKTRSFHVCGVDPALRQEVAEGDIIFIRGNISYFGHSAESLRLSGATIGA